MVPASAHATISETLMVVSIKRLIAIHPSVLWRPGRPPVPVPLSRAARPRRPEAPPPLSPPSRRRRWPSDAGAPTSAALGAEVGAPASDGHLLRRLGGESGGGASGRRGRAALERGTGTGGRPGRQSTEGWIAMSLLIETTIKVSLIVACALAGTIALRRRSAAARHWMLAAAIACAAAAPLLQPIAPS